MRLNTRLIHVKIQTLVLLIYYMICYDLRLYHKISMRRFVNAKSTLSNIYNTKKIVFLLIYIFQFLVKHFTS